MNEQELNALEQLVAATTKGPWHWNIAPKSHSITLMSGWDTVMDTKRWGMGGATLRFVHPTETWILEEAHKDAVPFPGRNHHKDWALTINPARADAAFIAAARTAVPSLIARVRALETDLEAAYKGAGELGELLGKYQDAYGPLGS